MSARLKILILAGGEGSRLWPISKKKTPKQVLDVGISDTMVRQVVKKCQKLGTPIVVTNKNQAKKIRKELEGLKFEIITEPTGKNTGPAVALATASLLQKNPEYLLIFLPVDQDFKELELIEIIRKLEKKARDSDELIVVGAIPTRAEAGYGYIKEGEVDRTDSNFFEVESFLEKPTKKKAVEILKTGKYLWNAGILAGKARVLQKEIIEHLPELRPLFINKKTGTIYKNLKPIGIEKGLLEKTTNLRILKAQMEWRDLGNWTALHKTLDKDEKGNCYIGTNNIGLKNKNTLIFNTSSRTVATIGLKNLIVATTDKEIFICHRKHSEKVKEIKKIIRERDK